MFIIFRIKYCVLYYVDNSINFILGIAADRNLLLVWYRNKIYEEEIVRTIGVTVTCKVM